MFWFKQKASKTLYRKPTAEEAAALAAEQKVLWREEILHAGGRTLTAYCNVGHGSPGRVVLEMAHQGLLTKRIERGVTPSEDRYIYTLTALGREALAQL